MILVTWGALSRSLNLREILSKLFREWSMWKWSETAPGPMLRKRGGVQANIPEMAAEMGQKECEMPWQLARK